MSETPQQPVALKTLQPSSSGRDLVGKSRMKTGEKLKGLSNSGNGVGNAKLTSYFNQEKSDDKLKAAIKTTKDVEIQTDQSLEVIEQCNLYFFNRNCFIQMKIENSILRHTGNTQWKSADKAECSRCARSNVVQMLIGSAPNEKYWELVAEERRIALQVSLLYVRNTVFFHLNVFRNLCVKICKSMKKSPRWGRKTDSFAFWQMKERSTRKF